MVIAEAFVKEAISHDANVMQRLVGIIRQMQVSFDSRQFRVGEAKKIS